MSLRLERMSRRREDMPLIMPLRARRVLCRPMAPRPPKRLLWKACRSSSSNSGVLVSSLVLRVGEASSSCFAGSSWSSSASLIKTSEPFAERFFCRRGGGDCAEPSRSSEVEEGRSAGGTKERQGRHKFCLQSVPFRLDRRREGGGDAAVFESSVG